MPTFLHTMVRITDPARSRSFYEALGFSYSRDLDIVRNGELEATNYFFSLGEAADVLELTLRLALPPGAARPEDRRGSPPRGQ